MGISSIFLNMLNQKSSTLAPNTDVPIGYFTLEGDIIDFHDDSVSYQVDLNTFHREHYRYVSTPKRLAPYEDSSMFWINTGYYPNSSDMKILRIHEKTKENFFPKESSACLMLFSFDCPRPHDSFCYRDDNRKHLTKYYILGHENQQTLVHANYFDEVPGDFVAYALIDQIYTIEHLWALGVLKK
mgnify:CR=1 FL=1